MCYKVCSQTNLYSCISKKRADLTKEGYILPDGYTQHKEDKTGYTYYYNWLTKKSQWEQPSSAIGTSSRSASASAAHDVAKSASIQHWSSTFHSRDARSRLARMSQGSGNNILWKDAPEVLKRFQILTFNYVKKKTVGSRNDRSFCVTCKVVYSDTYCATQKVQSKDGAGMTMNTAMEDAAKNIMSWFEDSCSTTTAGSTSTSTISTPVASETNNTANSLYYNSSSLNHGETDNKIKELEVNESKNEDRLSNFDPVSVSYGMLERCGHVERMCNSIQISKQEVSSAIYLI